MHKTSTKREANPWGLRSLPPCRTATVLFPHSRSARTKRRARQLVRFLCSQMAQVRKVEGHPYWSCAPGTREGKGEAAGVASVLAKAARSESAPSMRAVEPTPATSQTRANEQARKDQFGGCSMRVSESISLRSATKPEPSKYSSGTRMSVERGSMPTCSIKAGAAWRAHLIGYDRLRPALMVGSCCLICREPISGYTARLRRLS